MAGEPQSSQQLTIHPEAKQEGVCKCISGNMDDLKRVILYTNDGIHCVFTRSVK